MHTSSAHQAGGASDARVFRVEELGQIRCGMCASPSREHAAPTRSEGAVAVPFMDGPEGGDTLDRRSRHLPASIIVHANKIQRVNRCALVRFVERTHARPGRHCDRHTRLVPVSRGNVTDD